MTARSLLLVAAAGGGLAVASCGGGSGARTKGGYASGSPVKGRPGGTLTVLSRGDVDDLDPGAAYYALTFLVTYATQRPLYSFRPDQASQASPDLAVQLPQVSGGGRTVTVRLREGVRFGPPVRRAVTSRDVAYAIERGFNPHVANPYAAAYFGSLVGAAHARGGPIPGIRTPDPQTIVFRLAKPGPWTLIGALSLPLTAPVPPEYARRLDAHDPSTYGARQVATGPYLIRRYTPGREIRLARNPSWDPRTDYRPAYLDSVVVDEGNADPVAASRQILRGRGLVNAQADLGVPPSIVRQVVLGSAAQRRQFVAGTSTGRVRYVSLRTTRAPFDDVDVRRAIAAGLDRRALRRRLGGPLVGEVATHFIPPAIPGFEPAGGRRGPGHDFLARPAGDLALAARYLRQAGFPTGRYGGPKPFTMVAEDTGPARAVAPLVRAQLQRLGFRIVLRYVADDSRLCDVSAQQAPICVGGTWQPDFPDPGTLLSSLPGGAHVAPTLAPARRARAWARVDRRLTAAVPAVPWLWDDGTGIESRDVNGVIDRLNGGWDLSFTSLK